MIFIYFLIYLSLSQDLTPYPFVKNSLNNLNIKAKEKLVLNKIINIQNNSIKIDLDLDLELSASEASFLINKLPDFYLLETFYGNYILKGKGRLLKIKIDDYILEFKEGHIFISNKKNEIKLLVLDKTFVSFFKNKEKIDIKPKTFYEIKSDNINSHAFKNYQTHINQVFDIEVYKKLISENKEPSFELSKNKGEAVFCIKNLSGINIDNWYINTDTINLAKSINEKKVINICKEKYKDIKHAGTYTVFDKNCLYINNDFCQLVNVFTSVQLINISAVLLSGYDKISIKIKENEYYDLTSKWVFLQEGSYVFKLGKKIDKAMVYEEKKIILKGSKKLNLKNLL